ncbi:MAG: hypothetical protein P8O23_01695 [Opitutales bacterium]|nr:hypothetical protein [Opitutales bacterium]
MALIPAYSIEQKVVIHWSSVKTIGHAELLKDRDGQLLDAGAPNNGDGHMVVLGYFSEGNSTHPFVGSWTPLTKGTRVGDSSSGYGYDHGMASFTTVFTNASDQVIVYPGNPASYYALSDKVISSSTPGSSANDPPLCIRFYDRTTTGPQTRYNTVTGPNWSWPVFSSDIPENLYIKIASGSPPTGSKWKYGDIFENNNTRFQCSLRDPANLITSSSTGGSIVNVSGPYTYDTWVDINATPATHWEFASWSGGVEFPNSMNTRVQMTSDKNVTATFREHNYTLSISHTGKGSVTGAGSYTYNTPVTISATPSVGYYFSHWNGYGPDNNNSTTTFNMEQDHSVVAVFSPFQHSIAITSSSGGSASVGETSPYFYDNNYTLTANADIGFHFVSWTSPSNSLNILSSNSTVISTLTLDGNSSFHANFTENQYALSVGMGTGGDSVTPPSALYSHFDIVPVEANASTGYQFDRWDDSSGILNSTLSRTTDANMSKASGNVSITAQFVKKTYAVNALEGSGGNVILSNGPYEHFGVYDLNANPHPNYLFTHWSGDSNSTDSLLLDATLRTNKLFVTGPVSITANFVIDPTKLSYTVDLNSSNGGNAQIAIGSNPFPYDSNITIQAFPINGYQFSNWSSFSSSLSLLSSDTSMTPYLNVDRNSSFTAHFEEKQYNLTVNSSVGGQSVSPAGTTRHSHFSSTSVSANPEFGYKFKNWDDLHGILNNSLEGNTTATFANAGTDSNITAIFEPKDYNIQITQTVGGSIALESPTGPWFHFETYNITANPLPGYRFVSWTTDQVGIEALTASITESNNSLTLVDSVSLSANFETIDYQVNVNTSSGGSVSGNGDFTILNPPIISATPITGWNFLEWSGDTQYIGSSLLNPAQINLSSQPQDLNFTASFERQNFLIDVMIQGQGTVNDLNSSFSSSYPFQQSINLLPNPSTGWSFTNWLGVPDNQKNENPLNILVTEARTVTSVFSRNSYNVSFQSTPHGLTSGSGTYLFESNITIEAVPNKGYLFSNWEGSINSLIDKTSAKISMQMPSTHLVFNPYFIPQENVITTTTEGGGTVTGGGTYLTGTDATFSAIPNNPDSNSLNGYRLSYWEWTTASGISATSSENPLTLAVDSPLTIKGVFSPIPFSMHNLTVIKTSDGGHIFDDLGKETWDASLQSTHKTLIASVKPGWKFSSWSQNSGSFSISNPLEASSEFLLTSDSTVNANFSASPIKIKIISESGGTTSFNEKDIEYGQLVSIGAIPDENMNFSKWNIIKSFDYNVTIYSSSISTAHNAYFLNNQERPTLNLFKGFSYTFNLPEDEIDNFYLSSSPISSSDGNGDLSDQLTRTKLSDSSVSFQIPDDCPSTIYYHSKSNQGMGGVAKATIYSEDVIIANPALSDNTFLATADLSISASFVKKKYNVNFSSTMGGSLSNEPDGIFEDGTQINVIAVPNDHFEFSYWQGVESSLSKDETLSLTLKQALNVKAIFEPTNYILKTTSNLDNNNTILISQPTPYNFGQVVSFEALPIEHYQFAHWSGASSSSTSKLDLTIEGNTNLKANYSKLIYNLNVVPSIQNYKGQETEVFDESFGSLTDGVPSTFNTVLSLIAAPANRFEFLHWKNGDGNIISNQLNLSHTVLKTETIYGVFREKSSMISIAVSPQNSGDILSNGNYFDAVTQNSLPYGIPHQFTPKPNAGYSFVRWEINNEIFTDTEVNYDGFSALVLTAVYEPLPFPLEIIIFPEGSGNVVTQNSDLTFLNNSTVNLSAIPNPGYRFSYWNGNVSNVNSSQTSIIMQKGLSIYAYFAESTVKAQATTNTLSMNGELLPTTDGGYVNIASTYRIGTNPTISAFPYDGFEFLHWKDENEIIFSTSRIATVPKLTNELNVKAVFRVKSYNIDFFVSPLAGGHLFIQGRKVVGSYNLKVQHGEYLLITAVANPLYTFKEWNAEFGIIDLPAVSSASVKITSNSKITANFEATEKLSLTLISNPLNAGWFFGQGSHAPNVSHPLFAKARKGYEFLRWEGSSSIQKPTSPSTNFNLIENSTITAIFKVIDEQTTTQNIVPPGIHMLNLTVNDSNGGVVIGSGVFGTGWVDIACEAKEGYIFRKWEGVGIEDIHSSNTKAFLSKDLKITAYFQKLGDAVAMPQSIIPGSDSLGAGWLSSNWFGSYWRKTDDHWVLHSKMSWIYLIPYSNDSIWMWTDKMKKWLWTSKSVYPYFLSGSNSRWFWFDKDSSTPNRQLFFEYYDSVGNGKWHLYE